MNRSLTFTLPTLALPTVATLALATTALAGLAFVDRSEATNAVETERAGTIVDIAVGTGQHETLVAAVQAADFVDLLSGSVELTVFAPTDSAFAALPHGTVEGLLEPGNLETLREILAFHVVAGRLTAEDVLRETELRTLSGQRLAVERRADGVFVGGAKVSLADVEADNGIVHVVDGVLLPATDDLLTVASNAGSFGTLLTAVRAAHLEDVLADATSLTILAPTDDAFAALDPKLLGALLEPERRDDLANVLKLHVIEGRYSALELAAFGTIETLAGERLPVRIVDGRVHVGGAALVGNDVESTNATVHVLESVILPR